MQALSQAASQAGTIVGILLAALSERVSDSETLLPGVISDVGLIGVLLTVIGVTCTALIAVIAARDEQRTQLAKEEERAARDAELKAEIEKLHATLVAWDRQEHERDLRHGGMSGPREEPRPLKDHDPRPLAIERQSVRARIRNAELALEALETEPPPRFVPLLLRKLVSVRL